jgi:hypothetical protein
LHDELVTTELLASAYAIKKTAGQINVLIHAVGILLLLPNILEPEEKIEYVSLGAGNTGRAFDLETDRRIAEFKFIHWQGGAETIRQNALFKDFYLLAEHQSPKRKELFVLGASNPLKFLNGGRALKSVLSRNARLAEDFHSTYADRFSKVRDYYAHRKAEVTILDASPLLPELDAIARVDASAEADAAQL